MSSSAHYPTLCYPATRDYNATIGFTGQQQQQHQFNQIFGRYSHYPGWVIIGGTNHKQTVGQRWRCHQSISSGDEMESNVTIIYWSVRDF